jgi:hypothetical protein
MKLSLDVFTAGNLVIGLDTVPHVMEMQVLVSLKVM